MNNLKIAGWLLKENRFICSHPTISKTFQKLQGNHVNCSLALCSKLSMKEIKTCGYETLVPKLCCVLWSRNSDFENPNPS